MEKVYLHVDLDAFFASVEQREHPEYKGKPVIVGGFKDDRRSVVCTASYEARRYGVHAPLPIVKAAELCPNGIFLRGNYQLYSDVSYQIMNIFKNYSPNVYQMSIDEAFIDITGTERLFGKPEVVAQMIKDEVFKETQLTVSVGIASTMYVAKIASGYKKPNGLTYVPKGQEVDFMLNLPLEKVWGIGEKSLKRIKNAGFYSPKDIYVKELNSLISIFGENSGTFLYNAVRGKEYFDFISETKNPSISMETTFEYDLTDIYTIETKLLELSTFLMYRLHKKNARSKTICIKIRYDDFSTVSIQKTFMHYITNADELFELSRELFNAKFQRNKALRLLGLGLSKLEDKNELVQTELFYTKDMKKAKLEKAIFEMESKNPSLKLQKARTIVTEQNNQFRHDQND